MRTQLGSRKVQGIDYAYTLQGWIKGTNSQTLQSNRDIGKDGLTTHSTVAKDVFGYTLSYFASDYKAIDNSVISQNDNFIAQSTALDALSPDLWNGNIKNSVTALSKFDICHDPCIPIELKNATTNAVVYSNCIPPNANFNETITIGCASVQITYTTGDTHVIIASTENGSTVNYTITHTGGTATIATTTPALSCTTAQFVLGHNDGNKANIYWDDYDGTIATATLPITSTNTLNKIMNNCPVTASAKWDPQPTTTIELASHYGSNTGSSASLLAQYPWVSFNIPATPGGGWTPPITGLVKIHLDHVSASGFDFLINEAGTPLSATVVAGSGTTYVTGSSFGMFLEHVSSSKVVNCYMNLGGTDYKVATYSISAGSVGFAADLDISNCTVTDLVNIELIDVTTSSYVFEFYENGSTLVNISVPKNLPSTNSYFEKCGSYTLDFTYNSTLSGFDIVVQSSGGGTQTMVEAFLPINKANITLPTNGCFNIIATIPSNNSATPITPLPMAAVYNYDQLNRIKSADYTQDINLSTNQWTATGTMASYHNDYTYDANGNILTLNRKGIACKNLEMDKLHYNYYSNTNQLKYVWDEVADGNYSNDIDDQTSQFNTSGYNYKYDEIGNLIEDKKEGITSIQWNVYGKIQSVTKNTGLRLEFEYDPTGNRVVKRKLNLVSNTYVLQSTEFYVRDASGNVMANYTYTVAESALTWTESPIYGSSRIGVYRPNKTITDNINIDPCCFAYVRGERNYELTNHLGNVQAVITDKKIQVCSSGTVYFEADILTETDYYPFGMVMPERSYMSSEYRYGYNQQEGDLEIGGDFSSYRFRIYNSRLARFYSIDPASARIPYNSPYNFAENKPIQGREFEGLWVILISAEKTSGAIYQGTAGGGIAFSSSGQICLFVTAGYGWVSNIGTGISSTILLFPTMNNVFDAAGSGTAISVSGGEGASGGIVVASSGNYFGYGLTGGISYSVLPGQISYMTSITKMYPLNTPAEIAAKLKSIPGMMQTLEKSKVFLNSQITEKSVLLNSIVNKIDNNRSKINEVNYDIGILKTEIEAENNNKSPDNQKLIGLRSQMSEKESTLSELQSEQNNLNTQRQETNKLLNDLGNTINQIEQIITKANEL